MKKILFILLLFVSCNILNDKIIIKEKTEYIKTEAGEYAIVPSIFVDNLCDDETFLIIFILRVTKVDSSITDSIWANGYLFDTIGQYYLPYSVVEKVSGVVTHDGPWEYMDTGTAILFSECGYCTPETWNDNCSFLLETLTYGFSITELPTDSVDINSVIFNELTYKEK